jgi:hypothetical protein
VKSDDQKQANIVKKELRQIVRSGDVSLIMNRFGGAKPDERRFILEELRKKPHVFNGFLRAQILNKSLKQLPMPNANAAAVVNESQVAPRCHSVGNRWAPVTYWKIEPDGLVATRNCNSLFINYIVLKNYFPIF